MEKIDKQLDQYESELSTFRRKLNQFSSNSNKKMFIKQQALVILRQKKMYEEQKIQLQQQLMNLEHTMFVTDQIKNTTTTLNAMKHASKVFERQKLKFNEIEKIQDHMEDLLDEANKINSILARPYDFNDIDETELDAELEALEETEIEMQGETPSYLIGINELDEEIKKETEGIEESG